MPHQTRRLRLALAATVLTVTGLAGCADDGADPMPGMTGMDHGSSSAPATPPTSASPADGPHNAADVMFVQMMIPHHQQAIEMSDLLLGLDGVDPEVTDLATQIKAAQAPEITTMSGWLAGWGEAASPSSGMDHGMDGGGMMSRADLDALAKATGDDAARLYLTGMITHHRGAITMAEQELTSGENPDARQLAQTIIDTQRAEITTMTTLLGRL